MDDRNTNTSSRTSATQKEPQFSSKSIRQALAAVDTASLAHCHITEMHRIFSALVLLTKGNGEANGLAQVGDSLAERYQEEFFGEVHRLEEELSVLKGGAQ